MATVSYDIPADAVGFDIGLDFDNGRDQVPIAGVTDAINARGPIVADFVGPVAVPEPVGLAFVGLAGAGLMRRRRA